MSPEDELRAIESNLNQEFKVLTGNVIYFIYRLQQCFIDTFYSILDHLHARRIRII